jgi:hypothetical protein
MSSSQLEACGLRLPVSAAPPNPVTGSGFLLDTQGIWKYSDFSLATISPVATFLHDVLKSVDIYPEASILRAWNPLRRS